MRGSICLLIAAAFATAAHATDLSVSVRTGKGQGVADAVVPLYPAAGGDAHGTMTVELRMPPDRRGGY